MPMPSKIILLRHGEKPRGKASALQLSAIGQARARFLAKTYLGRGATKALLGRNGPDAVFAITAHTIQTASPSAESWGLPVTAYCTVADGAAKDPALDVRTRAACSEVMGPRWDGKTVVMVWEHKRIASSKLRPETTLRKLLNLDGLGNAVPADWPDDDYDTIWITTYDPNGGPPTFEAVAQGFQPPRKRKVVKAKKSPKKSPGKTKHKRKRRRP